MEKSKVVEGVNTVNEEKNNHHQFYLVMNLANYKRYTHGWNSGTNVIGIINLFKKLDLRTTP